MKLIPYLLFLVGNTPPPEGLRDIKGPAAVLLPLKEFAIWAGVLVGTLALLYLLYRYLKKRKERKSMVPEIILTPEERAMERLSNPALAVLLEKGEFRKYYSEISDALRFYLSERFQVDAMDNTTTELLYDLRKKGDADLYCGEIELFLQDSDMVKFAKKRPPSTRAEQDLVQIRDLVPRIGEDFKAQKEAAKMEVPAA